MRKGSELQEMDLESFYAGETSVLADVYRRNVARVERAVSRYCRGVDAENVIHDVFLSIIEKPDIRRQYKGGDIGAWLSTMAMKRAIDYLRSKRRWTLLDEHTSIEGSMEPIDEEGSILHRDQRERLQEALASFAEEVLPTLDENLARIYELRIQEQHTPAEAVQALGIPRTTFISREQKLMDRLIRYVALKLKERRP